VEISPTPLKNSTKVHSFGVHKNGYFPDDLYI